MFCVALQDRGLRASFLFYLGFVRAPVKGAMSMTRRRIPTATAIAGGASRQPNVTGTTGWIGGGSLHLPLAGGFVGTFRGEMPACPIAESVVGNPFVAQGPRKSWFWCPFLLKSTATV